MSTRILCLNLLVLVSVAFPGQAFRLALTGNATRASQPRRATTWWRRVQPEVGFAAALAAVATLAVLVAPGGLAVTLPNHPYWYAIAAAAGLLAPYAEYLLGAVVLLARRRRPGRIGLHDRAGVGTLAVLAALVVALAEEVIFRGIGLGLLLGEFGLALPVAIAVTSAVYGLNHLYYGWLTVAQKSLTGVGLALLFVWSGHSLVVPVVAHGVQNLVVLVLLPRWSRT